MPPIRPRRQPRWPWMARDEAAVSDVVGSILLVGITVLTATAFGLILFAFDGPKDTQHTHISVAIGSGGDLEWGTDEAVLNLTHLGGEPLSDARVTLRIVPPSGPPLTIQPTFDDGRLTIGESWTMTLTALEGDVFGVTVLVRTEGGLRALSSTDVPAGAAGALVLTYFEAAVLAQGTALDLPNAKDANDNAAAATFQEAAVGGSSSTNTLGFSTATGLGAAAPSNALASDNAYAVLDAAGDYVQGTTTTVPGTPFAITGLAMGFEGKGTLGAQTVALVTTQTGTAGQAGASSPVQNVGSVATAAFPAQAGLVYTAVIAHGDSLNPDRTVASVTGLGLTWTHEAGVSTSTSSSNRGRTELWVGTGSASGTTPVTATFSGAVEDAALWVSGWSGVDASSPIQDSDTGVSGGSGAWSVPSVAGTAATGRFVAAVNAVSASSVTFVNPALEDQPELDKDEVHLALAHAPALAANVASGTLGSSVRWQAIAWTLRPAPLLSLPAVQMTYHLTPAGAAGATALAPTLTGSDAQHTVSILGDRAWTVADIQALSVRVTVTDAALPGTADIDRVYLTVTTTNGPTTYTLDAQVTWPVPAQMPAVGSHSLQIRYVTASDTFTVEARSGTTVFTWRSCGTLSSPTPAEWTVLSCPLTAAETASGSPVIRIRDVQSSGTVQGVLTADYIRVATT